MIMFPIKPVFVLKTLQNAEFASYKKVNLSAFAK